MGNAKPEINDEDIERNKLWFKSYVQALDDHSAIKPPEEGIIYNCPCCNSETLSERGGFEICSVCFWEDDGQDEQDADTVRGGPNGSLSLTQARINFRDFGACERRFIKNVRKSLPK